MGYYKSSTSNSLKCLKCPANSWSFRSGQTRCKCQHEFFREIHTDYSTDCTPTVQLTDTNLNVQFIKQDRLNISISRHQLNPKINVKLRCDNNLCRNKLLNNSDEWLIIDNTVKPRFFKQMYQFKFVQTVNEQFLTESTASLNLNQARHENKNMFETNGIKCNLFENTFLHSSKSALCANISINLKTELTKFYSHLNIYNLNTAKLNVFALFKDRNFRLIPSHQKISAIDTSDFIHLRKIENQHLQGLIRNNSVFTMLVCNLVDIEYMKLELSVVGKSLDVYTVDFSLEDHCPRVDTFLMKKNLILTTKSKQKVSSAIEKLAAPDKDDSMASNLKVHVILPIILSFFMVTMLIFIAVFFRRYVFYGIVFE